YATRTRKVKTDRRDARALAEAGLLGAYRPAHRLSDAQRHVRGRLAVREALVRTRTRSIALIRALLRRHGWQVPTGSAETFSRRLLALAAWSILRGRHPRTEALRAWATSIAARRGKKIAVVALARRLAGILYAMLRDGTTYDPRAVPRSAAEAAVPV